MKLFVVEIIVPVTSIKSNNYSGNNLINSIGKGEKELLNFSANVYN